MNRFILRTFEIFSQTFLVPEIPLRCDVRDVSDPYRKEIPDFPLSAILVAYPYSEGFVRDFRAYKFSSDRSKFQKFLPGLRALARRASETFPKGSVVVWPPSGSVSDIVRGYPCAASFAREFARLAGFRTVDAFVKTWKKARQSELSAFERMGNVRGAFRIRESAKGSLRGNDVVVFDDVVSSGATVSECAKILSECGVSHCFGAFLSSSTQS